MVVRVYINALCVCCIESVHSFGVEVTASLITILVIWRKHIEGEERGRSTIEENITLQDSYREKSLQAIWLQPPLIYSLIASLGSFASGREFLCG